MDTRELSEAASLARLLSCGGVNLDLMLETDGVTVRGTYRRHRDNGTWSCRVMAHTIPYPEIESARLPVLNRAVVKVCNELTHDEELATDWRT